MAGRLWTGRKGCGRMRSKIIFKIPTEHSSGGSKTTKTSGQPQYEPGTSGTLSRGANHPNAAFGHTKKNQAFGAEKPLFIIQLIASQIVQRVMLTAEII
jgi:hypothetical protein